MYRLTAALAFAVCTTCALAAPVVQDFDGALGTSMRIAVESGDEAGARAAIEAAAAEVQRLERVLSGYDASSELSALNDGRALANPSADLIAVLALCDEWNAASDRKFSCKLGELKKAWQTAAESGEVPARPTLRAIARQVRKSGPLAPQQGQATQLAEGVLLDADGVAKGYIIDRAFDLLAESLPAGTPIAIEIGGDGRYRGGAGLPAWKVGVGNPFGATDTLKVRELGVRGGAVAASGHRHRAYQVGRRSYSHVLAPRDGWPVRNTPATVVVAPTAAAADAVATALAVMNPNEGIDWIESLTDVEAMVLMEGGQVLATSQWRAFESGRGSDDAESVQTLQVEYAIPQVEAPRYRRPYVAIWVSDKKKNVLRNLLVLGESRRWARENTRWWQQVGGKDEHVLDLFARPTRRPGVYELAWDWRDAYGNAVDENEVVLHVEAAREYGGHDYRRIRLNRNKPRRKALSAKGEIGKLTVTWQSGTTVNRTPLAAVTR